MLQKLSLYQMHHLPNQLTLGWQDPLKVSSENRTAFRKVCTALENIYTFAYELPSHKLLKKKEKWI